jgi:ribose 5-phosphate isomerase A
MNLKLQAAEYALRFVKDGMVMGLGTGSTTTLFIDLLGKRLKSGELHDIQGVPTSQATAAQAQALNIPLTTLAEIHRRRGSASLDLAVDGADEVDPSLDLIKGLGRALLREKVVEVYARQFIVLVEEVKLVPRLGSRGPLPVEILPFEAEAHIGWLNTLGCRAELWLEEDGQPAVTDNGNYLARCWFAEGIPNACQLARALEQHPGIIEHGLFLNMATCVVVAGVSGVRLLEKERLPTG